jgi:hypothetical protein
MNKKLIGKLMKMLLTLTLLTVVVGAIFKVQHHPLGNTIMITGLFANFIVSGLEISRLRKIIGELSQ